MSFPIFPRVKEVKLQAQGCGGGWGRWGTLPKITSQEGVRIGAEVGTGRPSPRAAPKEPVREPSRVRGHGAVYQTS